MKLPVSVIVPTIHERAVFLREKCLPAINANGEMDVIVVNDHGNGSLKRNKGAAFSTQPYLLFVDDDCVLTGSAVTEMLAELEKNPQAAFVYSDYNRIVLPGVESHAPSGLFQAGPFDLKRLRVSNYINTTSLIRKSACPTWDEEFEKFQDWDFWLTVAEGGGVGIYIQKALYDLYQIDRSVSTRINPTKYTQMMVLKHRLDLGPDPKNDWQDGRGHMHAGSISRRLAQGLG